MSSATFDPQDRSGAGEPVGDDLSIVPGMSPGAPLDMSKDPDRYDPAADPEPVRPLDPGSDPDRYRPPGQGQTLTDLLGEGAHEQARDNNQWALGLLGIVAFILFVSWLFGSVLSP